MIWEQCDITDKGLVLSCLSSIKPDHIYLIAGVLGTTELNHTPSKAIKVNVGGIATFIEAFVELNYFPRIFYVTKPNVWENMYTISKETSERIMKFYMTELRLECCIHRWFNAYGPGQHTHPVRKAVPYFIINALYNKDIEIWGDGNQTVDLIHIDDIAFLAVEAMNKPETTQDLVIDIGSGESITVNELAGMVIDLTNSSSKIVYKAMRQGEIENTTLVADTTVLSEKISQNYLFRDLKEGLEETIKYYSEMSQSQKDSFFDYYKSEQHGKYYLNSGGSK